VTDPDGGAVARMDPSSGAAVDRILVGGDPGSIVSGGGAIWTASTVGATVSASALPPLKPAKTPAAFGEAAVRGGRRGEIP
jgi:hypothetical protein